jgi:2-phospho-L-lactate guanylyltransferase
MAAVPSAAAPSATAPVTVVLPVKVLAVAKSRLPAARAALALAMAIDVAVVARSVGRVLVVTDDPVAAAALAADHVEPDVPDAGLSAAVAHGALVASRRWPDDDVVALAADLPALTSADLIAFAHTVGAAAREGARADAPRVWVVADAGGVGTAVLAAAAGTVLVPAYEGASFAAHLAGGATDLTAYAGPGLRRDVDTVADLATAIALGVGPATTASLALHRDAWRAAGLR